MRIFCVYYFGNGDHSSKKRLFGDLSFIQPFVKAIADQENNLPTNIVASYNIHRNDNHPVSACSHSRYTAKQLFLSFDEEEYNMIYLERWMNLFLQWANSEDIKKKFKYLTQFVFGGFINCIEKPHY